MEFGSLMLAVLPVVCNFYESTADCYLIEELNKKLSEGLIVVCS